MNHSWISPRLALLALVLRATITTAISGEVDEFSKCVVLLRGQEMFSVNGVQAEVWLKVPNGTNPVYIPKWSNMGTGFFVADGTNCFLVTAKHVAMNMGGNPLATMRLEEKEPLVVPLVTLTGSNVITWHHHTNADISLLKVQAPSQATPLLSRHFFPLELLESRTAPPSRDVPLTIIGFPLDLGANEEFAPLSVETKAASGILPDGNARYFLLQNPGIQGFSGAPLLAFVRPYSQGGAFIMPTVGPPKCWGLISETLGDATGGKLAKVVPAYCIAEFIKECR